MQKRVRQIIVFTKRYKYYLMGIFIVLFILWWNALPSPLFPKNYSQVVFSKEGKLLGARISNDEQWRFPSGDSIPYKFEQSILHFEDEYFYHHPGVNPISLGRAFIQNIQKRGIHSGASTLTMQTIRLSAGNPKRSYWEKLKEISKAVRLECSLSKDSILNLYASHAPFGGNVVGLEAAAWRYYGKLPHQLSWSESATLAVLPNAPSLIFPGKNQEKLKAKRDRLLQKLYEKQVITAEELELSQWEELPQKPFELPQKAPHFIDYSAKIFPHSRVKSTLSYEIQENAQRIVNQHHSVLKQREIQNIAVIISEVNSAKVVAYIGNTQDDDFAHQNAVDINQAKRSSGSILKPILYAQMLDEGELLPKMLLKDIPSDITENYSQTYQGRVAADKALIQSLNIPAINMLRRHGVANFHQELKELGFSGLKPSSDYYGLSLIVGGAEISPWDLNNAYRKWAYHLNSNESKMQSLPIISQNQNRQWEDKPTISQAAVYQTFSTLREVVRPDNESGWRIFGKGNIAWKTGTSHGFKDAWSVGITPDYVISVWVGNADGEGRPGIIGVQAAAPILFDLFRMLPKSNWFDKPDDFQTIKTCYYSGYALGKNCPSYEKMEVPNAHLKVEPCSFHQKIYLDSTEQYQVNGSCYPIHQAKAKVYFTLDAIEERHFQKVHPWYKPLPDFLEGCESTQNNMGFIYPRNFTQIFLPKNNEGIVQSMIVKIAHPNDQATITWTLDGEIIGQTTDKHELAIAPTYGKHKLTATDSKGSSISKRFEVKSGG